MSLKRHAVVGVQWTTLSTAVATAVQMVQLIFVARLLSSREFGLMGMVLLVVGFGQVFADAGLSAALIYRQEIDREHLSSLYWMNVFAGLAIFGIITAGTPLVALFFSEVSLPPYLICSALIFVFASLGTQFEVLFQKNLRFRLLAVQEISGAVAGAIAAIVLALEGWGVWSLVFGFVLSSAVSSAVLTAAGWKQWKPMLRFRRDDLRDFLSFGLYQMGERIINYVNLRVDQLVIGATLGTQALGYYAFSFNLVLQPQMRINPIITKVAFPLFARIQHDDARLRHGYLTVTSVLAGLNAPLLFGLAAIAPLAVPWIFGAQWRDAVVLVQVLSFFAFVRSTGNPVGSLVLAKGRADLTFLWNLILLFAIVPVVFAAAQMAGLIGVAWALVALQCCLGVFGYRYLIAPIIGACGAGYLKAIVVPAALAASMAVAVFGAGALLTPLPTSVQVCVLVAFGIVLYAALLRGFDRDTISQIIALRGSK